MPKYSALPTDIVRAYQSGQPDAYGQVPERAVSTGVGNPCRYSLRDIPEGQEMLILAHRPFDTLHPYAETGPIFLSASPCARYVDDGTPPEILTTSPEYLIKGYNDGDRIVYGTGVVTPTERLEEAIDQIFRRDDVAYIHVRSARNNCYLARVDRD